MRLKGCAFFVEHSESDLMGMHELKINFRAACASSASVERIGTERCMCHLLSFFSVRAVCVVRMCTDTTSGSLN